MTETPAEKHLIGYARVSTYGQTLDSQLEQLRKAGCTSRNIYREKLKGVLKRDFPAFAVSRGQLRVWPMRPDSAGFSS